MTSLQALTSARLQRFCVIDCSFVVEITPEKTVFNVNQALIKGAADSRGFFFFFLFPYNPRIICLELFLNYSYQR